MNFCYQPNALFDSRTHWGLQFNLTHFCSARSWGSIADLTDLRNLIIWSNDQGAAFVMLHGFHDIIQTKLTDRVQLYGNYYWDPVYLDIRTIPDFDESLSVQKSILSSKFQHKLNGLPAKRNSDVSPVRRLKIEALEYCYKRFVSAHLKRNTSTAASFRSFQNREGDVLRRYAVLNTLTELEPAMQFELPTIDECQSFLVSNYERIEFFEYIQWQLDRQFQQIGELCLNRRAPLGLCLSFLIEEADVSILDNTLPRLMRHTGAVTIGNLEKLFEHRGIEDSLDYLCTKSEENQCFVVIQKSAKADFLETALLERGMGVLITDMKPHVVKHTKKSLIIFDLNDLISDIHGDQSSSNFFSQDNLVLKKKLEEVIDSSGKDLLLPVEAPLIKDDHKKRPTVIPSATYRLQLNKTFTFDQANVIVPYLSKLGISHCYTSPILKARAGSMHGYDIVDHRQLNPEIGNVDNFNDFVNSLKQNKMGLVVDIVPNHMGLSKENIWWNDVLENGYDSEHADFFDIDWHPVKPELAGKILLPILGQPYGQVLKEGPLNLLFDRDHGTFSLHYYDHILPISPLSYPTILRKRLNILEDRLGQNNADVNEYLSILNGFSELVHLFSNRDRRREQSVQKHRLSNLCKNNAQIENFIKQTLQEFCVGDAILPAENNLHSLLEQQAYRLSFWRVSSDEINYRRFFDIDSLAAIRMELPSVFIEMHQLIFTLIKENKIDGLRIDHPDGLYDPEKYFDDLQNEVARQRTVDGNMVSEQDDFDPEFAPVYLVVEKILAPFEHLPNNWKVHGTTGYDYLNSSTRLLIDRNSSDEFDDIYELFVGYRSDIEMLKIAAKNTILESVLSSELNMLAHRISKITESNWYYRDFSLGALHKALQKIVSFFPVYRTYARDQSMDRVSRNYVEWAVSAARKASSPINARIYDFIYHVLSLDFEKFSNFDIPNGKSEFDKDIIEFTMKFQQFTGPLMAKSVEDTLFYRYNRFICLNEVGGEPDKFGMTASAFHFQNQQRQLRRPYEMISTSTHDTKRSEDIRARLAVISEIPGIWQAKILYWQSLNKCHKMFSNDQLYPDSNDEYMIYQNLVGFLPPDWDECIPGDLELAQVTQRLVQYSIKAVREAKTYTSWIDNNESYEEAVSRFIEKILSSVSSNRFLQDLLSFHKKLKDFGYLNSLTQTVLKVTSPGVPDIYQGCESWNYALVDPDNRQKVNFTALAAALDEIERSLNSPKIDKCDYLQHLMRNRDDGMIKLMVTMICLQERKKFPELFTKGEYIPLQVIGPASDHILAFLRIYNVNACLIAVPLRMANLTQSTGMESFFSGNSFTKCLNNNLWTQTNVELPKSFNTNKLINIFSQKAIEVEGSFIACNELFADFPIAVLAN